jgi:hypothetical protein
MNPAHNPNKQTPGILIVTSVQSGLGLGLRILLDEVSTSPEQGQIFFHLSDKKKKHGRI